ncbi:NAD(P)/FAD-dependent oxidoreductase [Sporosarcina sp. FSL K6-2383]|uniref:NAD(P)/FAD-dependent oxidoreductase n=1 Tax=Sporosarcina sp. FSL K6-2383 TaxID=2921556 RepID=UPI00315A9333
MIVVEKVFDCAILGAGPSGLSASLILGRSRRSVALFDNGTNRNRVTQETHGFLTRDGVRPEEFRNLALADLEKYPSVHFFKETVLQVTRQTTDERFKIVTSEGHEYFAEKIILATGIQENHPQIPEIGQYYGKSLFSCPYCDGWELRDQPLIVIAENEEAAYHMGKKIQHWSRDLVVATNGYQIAPHIESDLKEKGITVITESIERLVGEEGYLEKVVFASGLEINRKGGFIVSSHYRPNQFAESLGCDIQKNGEIVTDGFTRTTQKSIYVAGENTQTAPSSLLLTAAEGNKAAVAVNTDLIEERF